MSVETSLTLNKASIDDKLVSFLSTGNLCALFFFVYDAKPFRTQFFIGLCRVNRLLSYRFVLDVYSFFFYLVSCFFLNFFITLTPFKPQQKAVRLFINTVRFYSTSFC